MHILMIGLVALALRASDARAASPAILNSSANYPAQNFPSVGVKRIVIGGVRGRVDVRGTSESAYRLRVGHAGKVVNEDWGLSVERRGEVLYLEVFSTALGAEWKPLLERDHWPRFDLVLSGPAVPVVVGWRDGAVEVKDWPAPVDITLLGGTASVAKVAAARVHVGRGHAFVRDVAGEVHVRGEDGRLDLKRVGGATEIDWFSGILNLERPGAALTVSGFDAVVDARGGTGAWTIDVPRGRVRVADFTGRLNGRRVGARTAERPAY